MSDPEKGRFGRDTHVEPLEPGRYDATIDRGWWIVNGPNGGYVAAIVLGALEHAVADPTRAIRSLTLHYLRPPVEGAAQITTRLEREGRTVSTLTADLWQGDRLLVKALASFGTARDAMAFDDRPFPTLLPPERCLRLIDRFPTGVEMQRRYDARWAFGEPFSGEGRAACGGWIRLAHPERASAPLIAAFTDAFPPAVFTRANERRAAGPVPTLDLTIHFRETLPLHDAEADDFYAVTFSSTVAREGFIEEDGEIWTRSGRLVALSRQLAIVG